MKVTWITTLLAALTMGHALAQGVSLYVPSTPACLELHQTVITHATNGRIHQAEIALSSSLATGPGQPEHSCAGLILSNMAALMALWGGSPTSDFHRSRQIHLRCPKKPTTTMAAFRLPFRLHPRKEESHEVLVEACAGGRRMRSEE
jgi:hypothetical protein